MKKPILLTLICGALLAACDTQQPSESAANPTDTLAPIVSLTPRYTATPVVTRTPLPTFTFTPTETPIPPTPSQTFTPSPTPVITGIVSGQRVANIRSGPGETYPVIGSLVPGSGVVVIGQSPDFAWYNIQMEDGDEGWIASRLLRVNEPPTALPSATPSPDLTALALGTSLPTALIGGGTITPTPPRAAVTATPVASLNGTQGAILQMGTPAGGGTVPTSNVSLPIIDLNAINQTATALAQLGNPIGSTLPPNVTATFTPFRLGTPAPGTTAIPGATSAGGGTVQRGVNVLAYCNDPAFRTPAPTNLAPGSSIDVFWVWFAASRDYIDQHLGAATYEVTVNGRRLDNYRQYQLTPRQGATGNWEVSWYVPVELPTSGVYEITYRLTWSAAISDGYEAFGPGTGAPENTGSCTVTVR